MCLFLVASRVLLDRFFLIFGNVLKIVNRGRGAGGHTGATVDAAVGIHIHLSGGFALGLVCLRVDAVGRTDLDTERVLDAGISNYIGHDKSISADGMSSVGSSVSSLRTSVRSIGDCGHIEL